jgi:hypothetical protein
VWPASDGLWSGYTRSQRLELPKAPNVLATLRWVPEQVVRYAAAHPDEQVYGFSVGENLPAPYGVASGSTQ